MGRWETKHFMGMALEATRKTTTHSLQIFSVRPLYYMYFCLSLWQAFQCFSALKLEVLYRKKTTLQPFALQEARVLFVSCHFCLLSTAWKLFCACIGDKNKLEAWLKVSQMCVIFFIRNCRVCKLNPRNLFSSEVFPLIFFNHGVWFLWAMLLLK